VSYRIAKGYGPLHIQHSLINLGLDKVLVQEELAKFESQWQELITKLSLKKFGVSTLIPEAKQKMRQINFLQSRGFNLVQIKTALTSG